MATDANAIIAAVFPAKTARDLGPGSSVVAELESPNALIGQYSQDPSLPGYGAGDCSQAHPVNVAAYSQTSPGGIVGIFATGSGSLGAKISSSINLALQAIPIVGPLLSGIWNAINPFAHHAAAVAREQTTLCSLIPAVNQTLQTTDAEVASGALSAAQGNAQLEAMVSAFDTQVQPITQEGGNTCNAGCVMKYAVRAAANIHEQKYHNSPLYYLKHYWWVGAIAVLLWLFVGHRVIIKGG